MQNACRPSSAVHRFTHAPHALSRPKARSISRWYLGRLSSVSRLTSSAVRAIGESCDCSTDHGSPPSSLKSRPSDHGTYSCGIHSCATSRCRLRLSSATGSSADRSCAVSRSAMGSLLGGGRGAGHGRGRDRVLKTLRLHPLLGLDQLP